ncbi:hypothetical protein EYF80_024845 [Liparis tanakae]|uniref:Uncharacterized protein n=1 Tax=Liparis tanakae TaxID=230148 RepID=A0A4Z2HH77_9TELE|nr:hypothetical protein EYF80_024845 [Liparis tanakae]
MEEKWESTITEFAFSPNKGLASPQPSVGSTLGPFCSNQPDCLALIVSRFVWEMCGGSRVAAMYSKSASEGSSIRGVERCGVVSPGRWYKRKFVLPSSHEASGGGGGGGGWGWK